MNEGPKEIKAPLEENKNATVIPEVKPVVNSEVEVHKVREVNRHTKSRTSEIAPIKKAGITASDYEDTFNDYRTTQKSGTGFSGEHTIGDSNNKKSEEETSRQERKRSSKPRVLSAHTKNSTVSQKMQL